MSYQPALLALEDGTLWPGQAVGAIGDTTGEIVFNTSLTGYQEIVTDPSYHGQIVTMTMTHIGNYGVIPEDDESHRIWAAGLVVRDMSLVASNWRARQTLPDYLKENGVIAISDVDTRALVRHIRTHGVMRSALSTSDPDPDRLIALAQQSRKMSGLNLVGEVSCAEPYGWTEGHDWWTPQTERSLPSDNLYHVVALDFGIKRNILRLLASRGCRMTVVPADTSADTILNLNPDGIFLSNGPGDPAAATDAVATVRDLLGKKPLFGICLGHQILALALGATTYKLKFGHHGGNQPVQLTDSGAVHISSHNHGFAVDPATLPADVTVSHVNLNDNCCEGIAAPAHRAFSVQYHPESAPGPHDSDELFDQFIDMMESQT